MDDSQEVHSRWAQSTMTEPEKGTERSSGSRFQQTARISLSQHSVVLTSALIGAYEFKIWLETIEIGFGDDGRHEKAVEKWLEFLAPRLHCRSVFEHI